MGKKGSGRKGWVTRRKREAEKAHKVESVQEVARPAPPPIPYPGAGTALGVGQNIASGQVTRGLRERVRRLAADADILRSMAMGLASRMADHAVDVQTLEHDLKRAGL